MALGESARRGGYSHGGVDRRRRKPGGSKRKGSRPEGRLPISTGTRRIRCSDRVADASGAGTALASIPILQGNLQDDMEGGSHRSGRQHLIPRIRVEGGGESSRVVLLLRELSPPVSRGMEAVLPGGGRARGRRRSPQPVQLNRPGIEHVQCVRAGVAAVLTVGVDPALAPLAGRKLRSHVVQYQVGVVGGCRCPGGQSDCSGYVASLRIRRLARCRAHSL